MTARLLVVRHGEAEYETHAVTDEGGSLTTEGRAQSRALGELLAPYDVAAVYASSMSRATQTAELAARVLGVEVVVREGLREFSVGDFEGVPSEPDPIRPIYARWVEGDLDARIPGGESGAEGVERIRWVLEEAAGAHPDATVLVVSHGAAICTALPALARNMSIDQVHDHRLANCGVVQVVRDEEGWLVTDWPGLDLS